MSDTENQQKKTPPNTPPKPPAEVEPEVKPIPKVRPECDKRFFTLNCFYDNGGTPEGCHLENAFQNFNQLLKHSKECHNGGEYACQFCGMYFANVDDKNNHEGEFIYEIKK